MSSFTFTWPSGPKDVIVTGTFDNWSKTLPLVKQADGSFELTVPFPKDQEKILFKFVVDGEWATSKTYKSEPDTSGHLNNVLTPKDFVSTSKSSASKIPEAGGLAVPVTAAPSKETPSTLDPQAKTLDPKKSLDPKPELSTTVLPSSEGKQTTLGEPGVVIPKDPHSVSAFNEVRDVDAKALNEESEPIVGTGVPTTTTAPATTSSEEPTLSTTVLPTSEGKQTTLGEPGAVIPKDPHSVSAFKEVRDVDAKALNEESEPIVGTGIPKTETTDETAPVPTASSTINDEDAKQEVKKPATERIAVYSEGESATEPELSTTVLPTSEGKQTTLGEAGAAIPKDPQSVSAFNEVRDVDAKALNEESEPVVGTGASSTATAAGVGATAVGAAAVGAAALASKSKKQEPEPEVSTTVLPTSEGKQTTLGEAGAAIPKDPHSVSAFSEVRDVDAKALNEGYEPVVGTGAPSSTTSAPAAVATSADKESELSTTVLPSSEGKQATLGEPGAVIPNDPHSVSAFDEVRDVDAKALNEESEPIVGTGAPAAAAATTSAAPASKEPELSTTVLPTSEGKQTTLGEAGAAIPKDPQSVSAFNEVRDVDAKALNEESEPVVGTGAPTPAKTTSAAPVKTTSTPTEPEVSAAVLPTSEGKQTTLGEAGAAVPKNPQVVPELSQVRDVDAKALNETDKPIVGTGKTTESPAAATSAVESASEPVTAESKTVEPKSSEAPTSNDATPLTTETPATKEVSPVVGAETAAASKPESEEKKTKYVKKVVKKVKKEKTPETSNGAETCYYY
ncbi:unnamed protein product [Ambrosiozyma monospora]|uniref:Unnamed protein product n=1 Tax=Ambrosiozyma monospora TaxID=43982 RepID=A0ACB5SV86_AMBMO|nr:unnamed protein product [Ambrosiozyma monospora]